MSCGQAVADHHRLVRRGLHLTQRRLEDAAVRLHVAVVERRDRGRKQPLEREVGLERRQRALGVRDQADLVAGAVQLAQHVGHVLVHLEVMAGGPFVVDVARRRARRPPPCRPSPR